MIIERGMKGKHFVQGFLIFVLFPYGALLSGFSFWNVLTSQHKASLTLSSSRKFETWPQVLHVGAYGSKETNEFSRAP